MTNKIQLNNLGDLVREGVIKVAAADTPVHAGRYTNARLTFPNGCTALLDLQFCELTLQGLCVHVPALQAQAIFKELEAQCQAKAEAYMNEDGRFRQV